MNHVEHLKSCQKISNVFLDGSKSTLYMKFEKVLPSAQGMSIWNDRAFILYDTGGCGVYDLTSRNPQAIASFQLGSYNPGVPSKDYKNHANSCMFSNIHIDGNPIPLLYVTIGSGIGKDEDGFYYRCAVENITCDVLPDGKEVYHSKVLQVITYQPDGIEDVPFEAPCWGCPSFLIDSEGGYLYIFSARYRTTRGNVPDGENNRYIITKFQLPEVDKDVQLTPKDILDQFTVESDVLFTQGGTLYNNRIYYTFGLPKHDYPIRIMVFDLQEKRLLAQVDNMDEAFGFEEIECCEFYQGKLLCNTNSGSIFVLEDGLIPL
ncbi:MAG: hypothetical protein IJZ34_07625 [Lachnospiraceae bacterium]|nr:hypothetical protein [Lachnospiraceae bacterium]